MFAYGEGPNKQHRTVWDLKPDDSPEGKPVAVTMFLVDAVEAVNRDPERYAFHFPGEPAMP